MKSIKNKDYTPITINIPTDLLKDFTEKAKKEGIARSSLIVIAMRNYLENSTALQYMPQLLDILQKSNK